MLGRHERAVLRPLRFAKAAQFGTAVEDEYIKPTCEFLRPNEKPIDEQETSPKIRVLPGGLSAAQRDHDHPSSGGTSIPFSNGSMARLPGGAGTATLRPATSTPGLRAEADIDFTDISFIAESLREDFDLKGRHDIRRHTLDVIERLMAQEVYPGDHDQATNLTFWPGEPSEHLRRIEAEWIAMGRPHSG